MNVLSSIIGSDKVHISIMLLTFETRFSKFYIYIYKSIPCYMCVYIFTHICILYIVTYMWSIIGLKIRWIKSNKIIIHICKITAKGQRKVKGNEYRQSR